ncbi:MAG TPA: hypothetical protein VL997_12055 [Dyella sp.]|nr:hypothetical protein [Dyella sp.]
MSTLELKALTLQLSTVLDVLEKRIDHAARQSLQSTQALDQQSRQSLETANTVIRQALEQFRHGARQAIEESVRDALHELERTIQAGTSKIDHAIAQLNQRTHQVGRLNASLAWKTFIASALGSVAVIAVAIYASWHAHEEIKRSEWVGDINAAISAGHLAACPEGGVCAYVGNKWIRLGGK